ncbi:MAG: AAA family ATPase [Candidatus Binatia bacterium]
MAAGNRRILMNLGAELLAAAVHDKRAAPGRGALPAGVWHAPRAATASDDEHPAGPARAGTTLAPERRWLVEQLWGTEAVGIIGGEPKCCKSFLALDLAVSVASGTQCLGRFAVARAARVLLFAAEDPLHVVRERLAGITAARGLR